MLRSLFSGVSGMKNNQTELDVIGNNIANVNTTAFKSGRVRFQDMLSQTLQNAQSPVVGSTGGINPRQVGLGTQVAGIDTLTDNGPIQPTERPLDCAIQGEGYFVLSDGQQTVFSRDGAFNFDGDNNIVNSDGFKVMGYTPQTATMKILYNSDLSSSGDLNWGNVTNGSSFKKDSSITINGVTINIPAGTKLLVPADPNTPGSIDTGAIPMINDALKDQGINASLSDGGLVLQRTFNIDDRAQDPKIEISNATGDFAGLSSDNNVGVNDAVTDETSFTDTTNLRSLSIPEMNPLKPGVKLNNFSIEANGTIKGVYDDGSVMALGKIALANFVNPGGLVKLGENNYGVSANSGQANISGANSGGSGSIQQSSLEMSNVDLASQFTDMIIASRAFQANSRTITTSDDMLQELLNLKR